MRTNVTLVAVAVLGTSGCQRGPATSPSPAEPTPAVSKVEPTAPPAPAGQPRRTADVAQRGKYVAAIAGCAVCHTPLTAKGQPDTARLFAGGLEARMPSGGTWRAPNITPDRTGIGGWTDEQIIIAVRRGVRPDGKRLLPIMPYPFYHHMTDDDARALVAYLRTVPPVPNQVAHSDAGTMQPVELAEPIGNVDSPALHGQYLAQLMHCAGCHTPRTGAFAGRAFSGGTPFRAQDGTPLVTPNITSDRATGIGDWSHDDIIRAVRVMTLPDGSKIRGPMAMYATAWSQLTDDDAHALASYIKSIPAITHDVGSEQPAPPQGTR